LKGGSFRNVSGKEKEKVKGSPNSLFLVPSTKEPTIRTEPPAIPKGISIGVPINCGATRPALRKKKRGKGERRALSVLKKKLYQKKRKADPPTAPKKAEGQKKKPCPILKKE